ncbi:hypothetical protein [Deminuibacter soli]|uniref:HMA domain-containing protein n=1 Tax=Deminuibacter soli TaxID=2291815 RepID=A0A3E1NH82_9BACT|nr:hypothetical protein [Deminuibacter soli]RFM27242.1 hypothetical protein DXN05_14500 [Deminuibacter soli]
MELETQILVFKTNICCDAACAMVGSRLNHAPNIRRWTVDRNDCDKVLRVVAQQVQAADIIALVNSSGFLCEELPG